MAELEIDYAAVFRVYPSPVALLTPELRYVDANDAYLQVAGRTRDELTGGSVFDVFPDNPGDRKASGTRNLGLSLKRVVASGERDAMAIQRYDVEAEGRPGEWIERYWSIVNIPVLAADGTVRLVLHRVEEVTELIEARGDEHAPGAEDRARQLESDLFTRAGELQSINERLREAHARERQVGLTLQESMLPAPEVVVQRESAVRYRPASAAMNVCGDWYDLIDLDHDRTTLAVGDVVGHGLEAAGVMGQLRSALSAVARVSEGPARALDVLDLYSRSVPGAQATTAVKVHVDWVARTLVYCSLGHLPPAVARCSGAVEFLDQATNPPLGTLPEPARATEAEVGFDPGDVLVLYTDGLVERRDEDIDQGLARLAESLTRHHGEPAERLADTLLTDLLPPTGTEDDTALVILRL
ncbi:SpoIIE family protein phosphatase [Streptomyces sp. DSM 44915]|uniref:SpoIIE family protein phosphatase n=1 Tax=Streptomyces chisholmiae TaxID=3075540 RepID=A0ABU2JNX6_9ACTN|nr:SpoIIE family protein phosphatase [Streptomyces sp. DSM 44915]MDT0266602.1 SpoIIE family protein phosphatase [Streptomyces sp. DSM 44915]